MSEIEKLKGIALSEKLSITERMNAIDLLSGIGSKQAMLALLDVAKDGSTYTERMTAQDKVTEILRKLKSKGEI